MNCVSLPGFCHLFLAGLIFLKGKENKNPEEVLMLTGVRLHPEILSLTFAAGGFFFFPPLISGCGIIYAFT